MLLRYNYNILFSSKLDNVNLEILILRAIQSYYSIYHTGFDILIKKKQLRFFKSISIH
jgi:hypothetical protein